MTDFNIYFNGTCIDTLENSTVSKARDFVSSNYKNAEQCVVVSAEADQAEAVQLSKELHVVDAKFEAEVADVLSDAELTGAARERSGKTVCFSNPNAGDKHGVVALVGPGLTWEILMEPGTIEEAREFMRNYKG